MRVGSAWKGLLMLTNRIAACFVCVLVLAAAQAAGPIPGGDFEAGLAGWQLKAEGGVAAITTTKPAGGKGCLNLQTGGKSPVWALSPPLSDTAAGQTLLVTFAVRRGQAPATPATPLFLDLVSSPAELTEAGVWEAALPPDLNWHKVSLLLKLPPLSGPPCLAFGVAGGAGSWQVDDLTVQDATAPAAVAVAQAGEQPVTQLLPTDWAPNGLLEATPKTVGAQTELLLSVNGVELGLLPDFLCYRGYREAMTIFAVNRGDIDKTVHVELAGPPCVDAPAWDVPVKKNGTTTFRLAVQGLRQGEFWTKLTFTSAGDSKSLPVKVICKPSYPELGVSWKDKVNTAALEQALRMPCDLQVLRAAPEAAAFAPMVQAVTAAGSEYVLAPEIGTLAPPQYLSAVTALFDQFQPTFWLPYCMAEPGSAFVAAPGLAATIRKRQLSGGVLTPPLDLVREYGKNRLVPAKVNLLTADRTSGLLALTCRLPRLRPAVVLAEQVDGQGDAPGGAALALSHQSDLDAVRALINERQLKLPILVDQLQTAASSDERLSALALAKALVNCLYQGSTGVTFDAADLPGVDTAGKPDIRGKVLQAIQQELSSATPLVPLLNSADVSAGAETPITYKPFLRGGEGIVVLWNNTSVAKDVTIEFRSQPVVSRRVTLSYGGPFETVRWEPIMKFSEEAFKRGVPSIYLRLEPLQVQIHSFRLLDPHAAWLKNVCLTVPYVAPPKDTPIDRKETRTWWKDMLGGRVEKELGK